MFTEAYSGGGGKGAPPPPQKKRGMPVNREMAKKIDQG